MRLIPLLLLVPAAALAEPPSGAVLAEIDGRAVSLPRLKTEVNATLAGDLASVSLVQRFENPHDVPLNARYVFPLPADAAVHAMRITVGDQVVEGEIKETEEAERTYQRAQRNGQQAALVKQHRPNVFSQRVANLLPGHPIEVELEYVHVVPRRDGAYRFHFPMAVGPRFSPDAETATTLPPQAPVATGAVVDGKRVSITVHLDGGVEIAHVESPSHGIDVHGTGALRTVQLADGRVADDQDFSLRYRLATTSTQVGAVAFRDGRDGYFSLLIEPPTGAPSAQIVPREVVFVLDCSGSMSGVPLDASKRFVRQMLEGLRPSDRFRIIRFSTDATEMAGQPVPATRANLERGRRYLAALQGGGGTQMIEGLRTALSGAPPKGHLRLVVFLTDGYIGNDVEIVRQVKARRGEARLFSFGVGHAVNRFLLEEMARAGRGVARIVRPDADVEAEADRLAERLEAPLLTDLEIDWGEAPVERVSPERLPDLFLGGSLRVTGRYQQPGRWPITVRGRLDGRVVNLPVTLGLPEKATRLDALPIAWARAQIEDLMHVYRNPEVPMLAQRRLKKAVLELGLKHRLLTQWTAFVAVAKKVVNPGGEALQADVAVPQVTGVSKAGYGRGTTFVGKGAPEPATWAALLLMMLLGWLGLRRQSAAS